MKKHRGMRPHDIVVLLKVITIKGDDWLIKDLANELYISQSEVSESLNRSLIAGLISNNRKRVIRSSLFDFLIYGLKYVYPVKPSSFVRGMRTAHSAPPLSDLILSEDVYVWPCLDGDTKGFSIEPLYPNLPKACKADNNLYELLVLIDAIRIGNKREIKFALEELKIRLVQNEEYYN